MTIDELLKLTQECPHIRITIKQGRLFMESGAMKQEIKVEGIPSVREYHGI